MVIEGLSITKLLVVGALIVLLFGTKKIRSLGGDLGVTIKGLKKAMSDDLSQTQQTLADDATRIADT